MNIIVLVLLIIFFIISKYNVNILWDSEGVYLHYTLVEKEYDGQVNKNRYCIKLFKI